MNQKIEIDDVVQGIQDQRTLIDKLQNNNFGWDIVVGDAFVRGMRDIGYKSTAFAMAELIDNSIQAGAKHVDVVFGFDAGAKPTSIAIADDGHGMEPQMVRAALIWGAGTRELNRDGFGRYGYGLPSASVSQAKRVTVFSRTASNSWYSAYLDIDEISNGDWTVANRIEMPAERPQEPPANITIELAKLGRDFSNGGTIVVWEKTDRVDAKQRDVLRNRLSGDIGVIYRNYLRDTAVTVDGKPVRPCDPLFLTPGFLHFDLDDDRAVELPSAVVDVKDKTTDTVVGRMRVRYSRFPATFFRKPEYKANFKAGRPAVNERLAIADANNGIVFLRNGRQIDVVRPSRGQGTQFNATTDRFWGVEVDFDASLDEYFYITTSKQQVRPNDKIWDILTQQANVFTTIATMKNAYDKDAKLIRAAAEATARRASIEAIEDAERFRITKPPQETPERKREADDNLRKEVDRRAKVANIPPEVVERELVAEQQGNHHAVQTEDVFGAPFFRCEQQGGQRVLVINTAHPFYTEVYMAPGSTPRLRAGLEILLWTLGNAEVDSDPGSERRRFYEQERPLVWSQNLAQAITSLSRMSIVTDADENTTAA